MGAGQLEIWSYDEEYEDPTLGKIARMTKINFREHLYHLFLPALGRTEFQNLSRYGGNPLRLHQVIEHDLPVFTCEPRPDLLCVNINNHPRYDVECLLGMLRQLGLRYALLPSGSRAGNLWSEGVSVVRCHLFVLTRSLIQYKNLIPYATQLGVVTRQLIRPPLNQHPDNATSKRVRLYATSHPWLHYAVLHVFDERIRWRPDDVKQLRQWWPYEEPRSPEVSLPLPDLPSHPSERDVDTECLRGGFGYSRSIRPSPSPASSVPHCESVATRGKQIVVQAGHKPAVCGGTGGSLGTSTQKSGRQQSHLQPDAGHCPGAATPNRPPDSQPSKSVYVLTSTLPTREELALLSPEQRRDRCQQALGPWQGPQNKRPVRRSYDAESLDPEEIAWGLFPRYCRNPRPDPRRPGVSVRCGGRHCSCECYRLHGWRLSQSIKFDLDRQGMRDDEWKWLWLTVKPERGDDDGLRDLRVLRQRVGAALSRFRTRFGDLRWMWILDWTSPTVAAGSIPHDQWLIAVPPRVKIKQVRSALKATVERIAKRQGVAIERPVYCRVIKDLHGTVDYMTGLSKRDQQITLPPAPRKGQRIPSFARCNLLSKAEAQVWREVKEWLGGSDLGRTPVPRDLITRRREERRSRTKG